MAVAVIIIIDDDCNWPCCMFDTRVCAVVSRRTLPVSCVQSQLCCFLSYIVSNLLMLLIIKRIQQV